MAAWEGPQQNRSVPGCGQLLEKLSLSQGAVEGFEGAPEQLLHVH